MALQVDYINNENQTIADCYWRIGKYDGIHGGIPDFDCKIYCYETKEDADLGHDELYVYDFKFFYELNLLENLYSQIYRELKYNHPLFEGAIDI